MASRTTNTTVLVTALLFVIFAAFIASSTLFKATPAGSAVKIASARPAPEDPAEIFINNRGQSGTAVAPFEVDGTAAPIGA